MRNDGHGAASEAWRVDAHAWETRITDLDPTTGVHSLFSIKAKNYHIFTFAILKLSDNLHFQDNIHS